MKKVTTEVYGVDWRDVMTLSWSTPYLSNLV